MEGLFKEILSSMSATTVVVKFRKERIQQIPNPLFIDPGFMDKINVYCLEGKITTKGVLPVFKTTLKNKKALDFMHIKLNFKLL